MKILITGSNGLLGQKLVYALLDKTGMEVIATSKGDNRITEKKGYQYLPLDITDRNAVEQVINQTRPDCVINTAAMTNVDACELDQQACKAINIDGVLNLTRSCKLMKSYFIHISTDFVFDGQSGPYREEDKPNPLSYYAWSKLESEKIVMDSGLDYAILRTIIIYGVIDDVQRSNLVLWTKNSLEQGKPIRVITDQYRSPTLAEDLADACLSAAEKRSQGIFHICGPEEDLDSIINIVRKTADFFNLDAGLIQPVTSAELNQPAKRPPRTGFILDKARRELDYRPHSLSQGLQIVADQLKRKQN